MICSNLQYAASSSIRKLSPLASSPQMVRLGGVGASKSPFLSAGSRILFQALSYGGGRGRHLSSSSSGKGDVQVVASSSNGNGVSSPSSLPSLAIDLRGKQKKHHNLSISFGGE